MHSPTKKIVVLISSGLLVAALAFGAYLCGTVYFVIETDGAGGSAIWHDDECFIFMGQQVSGLISKRYQVVLATLLRTPIGYPERLQDDLAVFHLKGEHLNRYVVKDFGSGGGAFPFQGRVYFSRGGEPDDWPYVWEWTGTNFVRVPKSTAEAILDTFPPAGGIAHSVTAHIADQGWQEAVNIIFHQGLFHQPQERRYPINLGSRSLVLIASSGVSSNALKLEGRLLGSDSREILWSQDKLRYRQVSEREYQKLKMNREDSTLPDHR